MADQNTASQQTGNTTASFGLRLTRLMTEKGIAPKTLASEMGVHISSVYYWMDGQRLPSIHMLHRMAPPMGMSPVELFQLISPEEALRLSRS